MTDGTDTSRLGRFSYFAAFAAAFFLLIVGVATVVYGTHNYDVQVTQDTTIQASILASTVSAALAFDDRKAAMEYVDALQSNPAVRAAAIYDAGGKLFVSYTRDRAAIPPTLPGKASSIRNDRLSIVVPVVQSARTLGSVYVQRIIEPSGRRLIRFGLLAVLVAMSAVILATLAVSQRALGRANAELAMRAAELTAANSELRIQIEHREKAEAALRQSQKMEAIGHLTGGVAHDFNNILQVILGSLGSLRRRSARWNMTDDALRDFQRLVDAADDGGKRAAALTRQLLAFSRRQPLQPEPTDVNRLVPGIINLLTRTLGETIAVETVLAGGVWPVWTDPNQLENAILNLAVNARDAMPNGGKLTIETANVVLDQPYADDLEELKPGPYVMIAITDNGVGMSREVVAKAFEPFFTTKEVGKGTGLGLSQVYGFVKQSGGHIRIYSEPGEGTTLKMYLPRAPTPAQELTPPISEAPRATAPNQLVLVVEDEENVRAATVEILRELGYSVLEAGTGSDALELLAQHPQVQLLFTDVVLPGGLNGRQLAEEAHRRYPALKVLYTTGYARNAIVHHGRLDPGVNLIPKPFTYSDLAARVRAMLDGAVKA